MPSNEPLTDPGGKPRWVRRARWPTIASCVLAALTTWLLLAAQSHAAPSFTDLYLAALLGVCTLVALGWALITRAGKVCLLLVSAAFALTLLVGSITGAPLKLKWRLSESAFNAWVAHGHSKAELQRPFRAGLFSVERVDVSSDCFLFYDSRDDLSDIGDGIAYLPHGTGAAFPLASQYEFSHLDGPWYSWIGYS